MKKNLMTKTMAGVFSLALSTVLFAGCTPQATNTTSASSQAGESTTAKETAAAQTNANTPTNTSQTSEAAEVKALSLDEFSKLAGQSDVTFVDVRNDSFYNGYKEEGAAKGGHMEGAIQYSATWVGKVNQAKLDKYISDKGIAKEAKVVVYGSDEKEVKPVADLLSQKGYKVESFAGFKDYANAPDAKMVAYPNYETLVNAQWLKDAMDGKKPEGQQKDGLIIYEVGWGPQEQAKDYLEEHIPTAPHFNTDWIEEGPLWNLSSPETIQKNLEKAGINGDKTVVLYSADASAAGRVLYALKAVGIEDVKILNGGLPAWKEAGFETTKDLPKVEAVKFAKPVTIDPKTTIARATDAQKAQAEGTKLVSIRSWEEFIGKTSGYDYIPKAGEPKGAIWGFAGSDASSMQDYYDPDGTLRNPEEMVRLWAEQGIKEDDKVAFYCGTGWRATLPWEMTQMLGWKDAKIYDGGWNDWQGLPELPVQKGAPEGMTMPDSKNDFN